jgi:Rps23 Pro-64 3,4-dihydroxylase Tpa1-like proline 4-hydroxylase
VKLELKLEPFHHLIIDDFLGQQEFDAVLEELIEYKKMGYFGDAASTRGAISGDGSQLKTNTSFFMDAYPEIKNSHNVNVWNGFMNWYHSSREIYNDVVKKSWLFSTRLPMKSDTLISYYSDSTEYPSHQDMSIFTWLLWINKTPKKFTGGDLYFEDFDYKIEYKNNRLICFFSRITHAVTPVKLEENYISDGTDGRFCITKFQHDDK